MLTLDRLRRGGRSVAPVGAGVAVAGSATYVFLAVTARAVGPDEYSSFATLWTLVITASIGLWTPFEQETARLATGERSAGRGTGGIARGAGETALAVAVLVATVLLLGLVGLRGPLF